jgi:hypothetical protein
MYDLLIQLTGGRRRRRHLSDAANAANAAAAAPAAGLPDLTTVFKKIQPGSIKKVTDR